MNKIPTICYEDIYEFCETVDNEFCKRYYSSKSGEAVVDISIFAKYEKAREIINILTEYDYEIANMEFHDPEFEGYDDEYVITLCSRLSNNDTPEIWCEPAKRNGEYLINEADATYILDECNSKLVPKVQTDVTYFVELEDEIEDEYDDFAHDLECGNCEECHCDDEEYVDLKLTRDEMETLHMLCHIFDV